MKIIRLRKLNWKYNDSLLNIPHINNAIIITNPPYFSNYSASRKKVSDNLKHYFDKIKTHGTDKC